MVAVGLVGSFSGKSRSRLTSESRASLSTFELKVCVSLRAMFVSLRSWLPQKSAPKVQLLIALSSTRSL